MNLFLKMFVKQFTLSYRNVVLSVCPSGTLVYCGRTIGWIKMKVGMQIALGPGDFVLNGDPAPLPKRGHSPLSNLGPMFIVAKWLHG